MSEIPVTAVYFRLLNERNQNELAACFTDECEIHSPFGSAPYNGRGSLRNMLHDLTDPWQHLKLIPKSAYRTGDRIAVMWMAEGLGKNGAQVAFEGVSVFQIGSEGRIARLEEYWDVRAALKES